MLGLPAILGSAALVVIFSVHAVDGPNDAPGGKGRVLRWVISGQYVIDEAALFWARAFIVICLVVSAITIAAAATIRYRQERRKREGST